MGQGWFTNTVFWTYCEIYDTNDKVCPIRTRHQVTSTSKVAVGWAITVVCFVHAVVTRERVHRLSGGRGRAARRVVAGASIEAGVTKCVRVCWGKTTRCAEDEGEAAGSYKSCKAAMAAPNRIGRAKPAHRDVDYKNNSPKDDIELFAHKK
jgi:hypothetical protein